MNSVQQYQVRKTWLVVAFLTILAMLISGVFAAFAIPDDGRVNLVHHFGGDALYCVDRDMNPTGQFSDDNFGGMRLLDIQGNELWFLDADTIEDFVAQAEAAPGTSVLMLEAPSTYGMSTLHTFADEAESDIIKFVFQANDEWGKPNSIEFKFCEPIGAPGDALVPATPFTCPPGTVPIYDGNGNILRCETIIP